MRRLVFYLILLIFAVLLGLALHLDSGYVLLAYHRWTIEMPLWFAIIAIVLFFVVLDFVFGVFRGCKSLRRRWLSWRQKRSFTQATTVVEEGFIAFVNADWKRMEKLLIRSAKDSAMPLVHYLGAAFAADKQGNFKRRTEYIQKAYGAAPHERVAIGLMQAQLQLEQGQFELARAILKNLRQIAPRHAQIYQLLKTLYIQLNDWPSLLALLPTLQKTMGKVEFQSLQIQIYSHLLSGELAQVMQLKNIWKQIPHTLQLLPSVLHPYCVQLTKFSAHSEAAELIESAIRHQWDDSLIALYGNLHFMHPEKKLHIAEKWLSKQRHNPVLLLTLAKIAAQFKHWAKAKEYCITSLRAQKTTEAYALLGALYAKTGALEQALQAYEHIKL